MKSRTIISTMIAYILTISALAQNKGYTILGNIKGLPDDVTFYLILNKDGGGADTISRAKSKGQKFQFKGILEEDGRLAFVKIDTSSVKISSKKIERHSNRKQTWVRLLLYNSEEVIQLNGGFEDWPEINIEGAKSTKEYEEFFLKIMTLSNEINTQTTASKMDSSEIVEARKRYNVVYLNELEKISDSYAVPLILYSNKSLDLEVKDAAYERLSVLQKNSYYGRRLKQKIISTKASKNIGIGKIIPDFMVKSPEGKRESIRTLATKSKYTLIDFWASWCKPCRVDIPNMKKVYSAFNSKGFNILSVSTDSSLQSWEKALKEENTPWINVREEGRSSKDIFGLFSIPGYILLNEKAEIVQMDLNSEFLSKSAGTLNGMPVILKDRLKKGLSGDDLYQVIEGLLDKSK